LADAEIADLMGSEIGNLAAGESDRASARPFDAGNGADQRRLARAVGADDRHNFALRCFD
jgi:hypothetical protein